MDGGIYREIPRGCQTYFLMWCLRLKHVTVCMKYFLRAVTCERGVSPRNHGIFLMSWTVIREPFPSSIDTEAL